MARMPSTRRLPQAPAPVFVAAPAVRQPAAQVPVAQVPVAQVPAVALAPAVAPGQSVVVVAPEVDELEAAASGRAGGFHESSYELRLGLEVSESGWPDDALPPRDWPATR